MSLLELLLSRVIELDVRDILASEDTEAVNIIERKRRHISYLGCAHTKELCALDVLEKEGRA